MECVTRCRKDDGVHSVAFGNSGELSSSWMWLGTTEHVLRTLQVAKDFSATSLIGPLASGGQILNSSVISYLYQLISNLEYSLPGFSPKMQEILKPSIEVGIFS